MLINPCVTFGWCYIQSCNILRDSFASCILNRFTLHFKDTPKAFDDCRNKQKSAWNNVFWYVKVCIFWKCIQYTIHWDETQMLEKYPSDKINVTKNVLFFLSQAPTYHSFTFNLQFLYELKHKVRLSKTVWDFPFPILLYFCSTKCMDTLTLKRNSFQN